jgi:hypothetical protein
VLASKLMTRNMIEANTLIFQILDSFCAARADPIANAGSPRWIFTNARERDILKNAKLSESFSFTRRRGIASLDLRSENFFCTVGFDHVISAAGLVEREVDAGLLTTLLSELRTLPVGTTSEIRNVVEVDDKSASAAYDGHNFEDVEELYPAIRVFGAKDLTQDETWKVFFCFACLKFAMRKLGLTLNSLTHFKAWANYRFSTFRTRRYAGRFLIPTPEQCFWHCIAALRRSTPIRARGNSLVRLG